MLRVQKAVLYGMLKYCELKSVNYPFLVSQLWLTFQCASLAVLVLTLIEQRLSSPRSPPSPYSRHILVVLALEGRGSSNTLSLRDKSTRQIGPECRV